MTKLTKAVKEAIEYEQGKKKLRIKAVIKAAIEGAVVDRLTSDEAISAACHQIFLNHDQTPGKKNLGRPGDFVVARKEMVDWYLDHLVWWMTVKNQQGEPEFQRDSLKGAGLWIDAHVKGYRPKGVILGYSGTDEDSDLRNVLVKFKHDQYEYTATTKEGWLHLPPWPLKKGRKPLKTKE